MQTSRKFLLEKITNQTLKFEKLNEKPNPKELKERCNIVNTLLNDTLTGLRNQVIHALDELAEKDTSDGLDNQLVKRVLRCVKNSDMLQNNDPKVLLDLLALVQHQLLNSGVGSSHGKVLFAVFHCMEMLYNTGPSHPDSPLRPRMRKLFLGDLMDRLKRSDENNVSIVRETLRIMFFLIGEPLNMLETTCMSESLNVQRILRVFDASSDSETIRFCVSIISRCMRLNYISRDDFQDGIPKSFSKTQASVLINLFDDLHAKNCVLKDVMTAFGVEWKKCHTMKGFEYTMQVSSQGCSLGRCKISTETIQVYFNEKQDDGVITMRHGCTGTTSNMVDVEFGNVKEFSWNGDTNELTLSLFEPLHDFHSDKSSSRLVVIQFIKNENERNIDKIRDAMELKRKYILKGNGPVFSASSESFGFNADIKSSHQEKIVDRILEDNDPIVGNHHVDNSLTHVDIVVMSELTSSKQDNVTNLKRIVSDVFDEKAAKKKLKLEMGSQSDPKIRDDFTLEGSSNHHIETGGHIDSPEDSVDTVTEGVSSEDRTVDPSESVDHDGQDGDDADRNLTGPETRIQKFKRISSEFVPVLKKNLPGIQSGKTDIQTLKEIFAGIAKCDKAFNESRHNCHFRPDDFRVLRPEDISHIDFEVEFTDSGGIKNVKNRPVVRIDVNSRYVGGTDAENLLALYDGFVVDYVITIDGDPYYFGMTQNVQENLFWRHWPLILDPSKSDQQCHRILHELGMKGCIIEYMIVAVCRVPKGVDSNVRNRRLAYFVEAYTCYLFQTIKSLETGRCNVYPGGSNGTLPVTLAEWNIMRLPIMKFRGFKGNDLNFLVDEAKALNASQTRMLLPLIDRSTDSMGKTIFRFDLLGTTWSILYVDENGQRVNCPMRTSYPLTMAEHRDLVEIVQDIIQKKQESFPINSHAETLQKKWNSGRNREPHEYPLRNLTTARSQLDKAKKNDWNVTIPEKLKLESVDKLRLLKNVKILKSVLEEFCPITKDEDAVITNEELAEICLQQGYKGYTKGTVLSDVAAKRTDFDRDALWKRHNANVVSAKYRNRKYVMNLENAKFIDNEIDSVERERVSGNELYPSKKAFGRAIMKQLPVPPPTLSNGKKSGKAYFDWVEGWIGHLYTAKMSGNIEICTRIMKFCSHSETDLENKF